MVGRIGAREILGGVALCVLIATTSGVASRHRIPVHPAERACEVHRRLLDREPRGDELTTALLESQEPGITLQDRVLDSAEFRARVDDVTFLVGLYLQTQGRHPQLHDVLIGLHFLGEGAPRSLVFDRVAEAAPRVRDPGRKFAPGAEERLLDFRQRRLHAYRRLARAYPSVDDARTRELLAEEAGAIDGAGPRAFEPGLAGKSDPEYNVYHGYIHAHTDISFDAAQNGSPGPFAAFDHARNVAGLDFLGLSDHAEYISSGPFNNEWQELQDAVDAYNAPGVFVALRGFEYSNPIYGHINVFGTDDYTGSFAQPDLAQFYDWLSNYPEAAATFNHPGDFNQLNQEFDHYQFEPDVAEQMVGIELLTHLADYSDYSVGYNAGNGLGHMDEAIDSGWRVASVSAQDNHSGGWGTIDDYRTGVLALALTQADILEALRQRRFFSTQDKNLTMSFRALGHEMGSILGSIPTSFAVHLDDADGETFQTLELWGDGQLLQSFAVTGTGTWDISVAPGPPHSYYYVLVTQNDGDQAMSAPIWVGKSLP